jgi:type III restriction enzyme
MRRVTEKWVHGQSNPVKTIGEAQLIGRGARYFPFQLDKTQDKYKRKFDEMLKMSCELRNTLLSLFQRA